MASPPNDPDVGVLVGLPITTAGCGCPAALLSGVIVAQGSDLSLGVDTGDTVHPVRWPFGYGVRQDADGLVLTDLFGNVMAREGDLVTLPGGETNSNDDAWRVCGEMEVVDGPE